MGQNVWFRDHIQLWERLGSVLFCTYLTENSVIMEKQGMDIERQ